MAIHKSTRASAIGSDVSKLRGKRGKRGYRMYRNGLLNVTPIGEEIAIKRNAQASPLLRLPAEIRTMIWKYGLGSQKIRLHKQGYHRLLQPARGTAQISFQLLRVCRQIYAEAALLPRMLNTPSFASFTKFATAAIGQLHNVRKIEVQTQVDNLYSPKDFEELVPVSIFEPFQAFEITLSKDGASDETGRIAEDKLKERLTGKDVVVHFVETHEEMYDSWLAL